MRKASEFMLMGMLAVAPLLMQACATHSGSVGGDDLLADGEYVDEQKIKHIPPPEFSLKPARTRPSLRAELSAINATGLPQGALSDVLFDFDQATLRKLYLLELGLPVQFKITSYGKDRPVCVQHSNACLQRNRSVHFVAKE